MLTISRALTSHQGKKYYQKEYSKGDYYQQSSEVCGQWQGVGAERLGLTGDVSQEQFGRVLDGQHPRTRSQFIKHSKNCNVANAHRAGWDLTFSAPKSVSCTALIGGDQRLVLAHERAVAKALEQVEQYAGVRDSKDRSKIEYTGNFIAAKFTHDSSRALDPQLHTHCVIMNMSRSERGWRAMEPREIFRAQQLGTTVYRAELAAGMWDLGYEVAIDADGVPQVAGRSKEYLDHFSQRRKEILASIEADGNPVSKLRWKNLTEAERAPYLEKGRNLLGERASLEKVENTAKKIYSRDGFQARYEAAHGTRRAKKNGIQHDDLYKEWQERAMIYGVDERLTVAQAVAYSKKVTLDERQKVEIDRERAGDKAVKSAVEHLTERNTIVTQAQIVEATLTDYRYAKLLRLQDIERAIQRAESAKWLISGEYRGKKSYTTTELKELELENIQMVTVGQGEVSSIAARKEVDAIIAKSRFGEQQAQIVRDVLTSTDRVRAVHGSAGTGKTYTLQFIKEQAEAYGYTVRAFALTHTACDVLRRDGLTNAQTVALLLANAEKEDQTARTGNELWFVDEASLVGTRHMNGLLRLAKQRQARVILIGDVWQHQIVSAGRQFEQLQEKGLQATVLDNIQRQKEVKKEICEAVRDFSKGKVADGWQKLNQIGAVIEVRDQNLTERDGNQARYRKIAELYSEHSTDRSTIAVAPTNDERQKINAAIREQLHQQGRLGADQTHEIYVNCNLTKEQRKDVKNYIVGNKVAFLKGSEKLGVKADVFYAIVDRNLREGTVTIEDEKGKQITYDPARLYGIHDVYRRNQREFAVGDKIMFRTTDRAKKRFKNGDIGIIKVLGEEGRAKVEVDDSKGKRQIEVDFITDRQLDHAYCVTSYRSQGMTADKRVIVLVDTRHRQEVLNSTFVQVAGSRLKEEVLFVTNNAGQVTRHFQQESATLDLQDSKAVTSSKGNAAEVHLRQDSASDKRGLSLEDEKFILEMARLGSTYQQRGRTPQKQQHSTNSQHQGPGIER